MTCIVAISDGKTVWIGGDAAGVNTGDLSISVRSDKKVFIREHYGVQWGFGFTSSFRMGQLIQYELDLPQVTKNDQKDMHRFMVKKFIPKLRKTLSKGGYSSIRNNTETGGAFIVGLLGHIFIIDNDFQVGGHEKPLYALGCGESYALGALYALEWFRDGGGIIDYETELREALEAAAFFSAGVQGPFTIITVPSSSS